MPRTAKSSTHATTRSADDAGSPTGGPADPDSSTAQLYIGTSGWAYPTWKPDFYPAKTPARLFLREYADRLNSVEVNYTFRALPTPAMLASWLALTPSHFRFSFKAPQRITHFSRLRGCDALVRQFLESLAPVRDAGRLGLLLFQLPPNFAANLELLGTFLTLPELHTPQAPRVAFEFRHASWFTDTAYTILRTHDAALCIAESDDLRTPEVHTASTFTCFRLRRDGGYADAELEDFARRFVALTTGPAARDVFVYHKHEDEPTGALNAAHLRRRADRLRSSDPQGTHA